MEVCLFDGRVNIATTETDPTYCKIGYTASSIILGAPQDPNVLVVAGSGFPSVTDPLVPNGNIVITSTFGNSAHVTLHTNSLILTRDPTGSWVCTNSGILQKYLPKGCN
ncbi:MAG: pilin [Betaproteobacteria bacterium]|nr:pilin [Betaproteobacteria bacterium]